MHQNQLSNLYVSTEAIAHVMDGSRKLESRMPSVAPAKNLGIGISGRPPSLYMRSIQWRAVITLLGNQRGVRVGFGIMRALKRFGVGEIRGSLRGSGKRGKWARRIMAADHLVQQGNNSNRTRSMTVRFGSDAVLRRTGCQG